MEKNSENFYFLREEEDIFLLFFVSQTKEEDKYRRKATKKKLGFDRVNFQYFVQRITTKQTRVQVRHGSVVTCSKP